MSSKLISAHKSIIPACDVDSWEALVKVLLGICGVPGVSALKIGAELGLTYGLKSVVDFIRAYPELREHQIIYDHQKGGTDIPPFGSNFVRVLKRAGITAAILFPFGGRVTEVDWIKALQDQGIHPLVGAEMTQDGFLVRDGGFIADDAPLRMFDIAIEEGVRDFVVPGNKVDAVEGYRRHFERVLGNGEFTLYAPGFIGQGGSISETGEVAGENWHAIVGGALYNEPDADSVRRVATQLTSQIS